MDFSTILIEAPELPGFSINPYAGKTADGKWLPGYVSISYLNSNFGEYTTATEMKGATEDEGYKKFFDWLVDQGKLPA